MCENDFVLKGVKLKTTTTKKKKQLKKSAAKLMVKPAPSFWKVTWQYR